MAGLFSGDQNWKPVSIGAGGWLTGMDISKDGTMVARADTYGAYLWTGSAWTQIVTAQSMPSTKSGDGVYEIRISASDSNVLFMAYSGGIYKSADRGSSWTLTSFPQTRFDPGSANRLDGEKLAIDPSNPNVVYVGTQKDGLWVTRDGGTNWQKITAVPQGGNTNDPSMTGIVIQGDKVFVGTAGSGVWQSSDSGVTWKSIGGPTDVSHAAIAPDGTYYATGNTDTALWKFANGSWTKLIASGTHGVAINPFDAKHIVVADESGRLIESKDGGASWGDGWNNEKQLESSNDVPWLENSGLYMSAGTLMFDPSVSGKLWLSAGVGIWSTQLPDKLLLNTKVVWNSQSRGIEQLVANDIIAPAGSDPLFASWDRAFFSMSDLDEFATNYSGGTFSMGWSVDYASSKPSFMVGISDWWGTENSGFSSDGGKTWQKFEGMPSWAANTVGGAIAASTPSNFIWVASGNQPPAYTLDGGKTWSNISIPGLTEWSQVHGVYYLQRTTITADRVQPNTFYLYDSNSGVYRTTDGGVSWSKMFSGQVAEWSFWNVEFEAMPGRAGDLFFTSGSLGYDVDNPDFTSFMRSTDGGATWKEVSGVGVSTFGFGAPATPGGPASIFIVGKVNGDLGIFYSADDAKSWVKIGQQPMGSLDHINNISGDMDQFGLVYIGFAGSGYAYLDFVNPGSPAAPPPAPPQPPAVPAPTQLADILQALDDAGPATWSKSGSTINDSTPTLSGNLSALLTSGQKLVVYRDGQFLGDLAPTSSAWTFTDPGARDGSHQYTVRVEDAKGQAGAYSSAFSLTIDTLAPVQQVTVTGASSGAGAASTQTMSMQAMSLQASSGSASVSGTINGALAAGETLNVFRDGVKVGVGTVSNGTWSFNDNVSNGSFQYSAQVEDSAGNLGGMSKALTVSLGVNNIFGTNRSDMVMGTSGADMISGLTSTGGRYGRGSVDVLTGGGDNDIFVLGDSRSRYYDDGSNRNGGTSDYARITDFAAGDKLQLKGSAAEYLQGWISNLNGHSGVGVYHDTNGNGMLDRTDELIALVQGPAILDLSGFIYI